MQAQQTFAFILTTMLALPLVQADDRGPGTYEETEQPLAFMQNTADDPPIPGVAFQDRPIELLLDLLEDVGTMYCGGFAFLNWDATDPPQTLSDYRGQTLRIGGYYTHEYVWTELDGAVDGLMDQNGGTTDSQTNGPDYKPGFFFVKVDGDGELNCWAEMSCNPGDTPGQNCRDYKWPGS